MGWTVDPATAQAAINNLGVAPDELATASDATSVLVDLQTSSKWGTEPGPTTFMNTYSDTLTWANDEVTRIESQLLAYVSTIKTAITTFSDTDDDIKTQMVVIEGQQDAVTDTQSGEQTDSKKTEER